MARTARDIMALYEERRQALSTLHQAALVVRDAYYGDIVLAAPEAGGFNTPMVANLLYQGGEQRAMRVASTTPDIRYPSTTPGQDLADKRARYRRLVNRYWWDEDKFKLKLRKRARHLVYYASCPVVLRPDFKTECPTWQVRNPLCTFPPLLDTGEINPPDVIFTMLKSYSWLAENYASKIGMLNTSGNTARNFTLLEYIDGDVIVLAVMGDKASTEPRHGYGMQSPPINTEAGEIVELERLPNRAGRCLASIPGRIGLEAARGEFDGVVGIWQAQAMLMSLSVLGMQRGIWPEQWLVDGPGTTAEIVTHADPLQGTMGHITGGTLEQIHVQPEAFANNLIDRLERAFRIESGVPAELGGESGSNIRTGRRGDAVLSAVLDFPIQEEQELLEVALAEENRLAIAVDKAWFDGAKTIYFTDTGGALEYTPSELFTTDRNRVVYAHAGVDAQGLTVEMGQRVGMGTMSRQTAMEMDPLIDDPEAEIDRITLEQIRAGLQGSLAQMAADPNMAPVIASITQKLREGDFTIEDAVLEVQKIQQQAQEQAAQAAAQQAPPPEQGVGPLAPVGAPPQGLGNLASLLGQLHTTDMAARNEQTPQLQAV